MNLSIVNIAPEEYRSLLNELAEILNMGSANLSIQLQDEAGNIYYGCHSWWSVDKYIQFKDLHGLSSLGLDVEKYKPAIKNLTESIIDTANMPSDEVITIPSINWNSALKDLNLTIIEKE